MRARMEHEIRAHGATLPAASLARLLFSQPYLRIENIVDAGLAHRQTAARWLTDLADAGLIVKERIERSVVFINARLLDTLFRAPARLSRDNDDLMKVITRLLLGISLFQFASTSLAAVQLLLAPQRPDA